MSDVRVRFAPSPTGFVHIGSLRTALYNYLFAKKNSGVCILRIEDTDQNRFVEGAIENLFETLNWAGIDFDESIQNEGNYGPYQQSHRIHIYKEYVQKLLDAGQAYPCFATADELDQMREDQISRGKDPKYDGRYRDYPEAKVKERIANGESFVVRMRVPDDGETIVKDIIRGNVHFQNNDLDDQVILKSDGFPTYHLANVVDDHLMKISHVIRGEEWLPSTPKHVILYNFFGWKIPQFAHLPLLLNADRSKLSKRQGDVAVEDYKAKGYLPEALLNYVALLGWSVGTGDREIFNLDELIESFTLENVNKAGAVFDIAKLDWMNGHYIRNIDDKKLNSFLEPFLAECNIDRSDRAIIEKIIQAIKPRINKGIDVKDVIGIFISDIIDITEEEALDILKDKSAKTVLEKFIDEVKNLDILDNEKFKLIMKTIQTETGIKGPQLWKPVRVAITGVVSGPDLPIVIDIFGKDKVLFFVDQVIKKYV